MLDRYFSCLTVTFHFFTIYPWADGLKTKITRHFSRLLQRYAEAFCTRRGWSRINQTQKVHVNRNLRLVYLTLGGVVQSYTHSREHLHDALSYRLRGHNIHPACSPGRVEPIGGEAAKKLINACPVLYNFSS